MAAHVRLQDVWKRALGLWVKVGGAWKQVVAAWIFKDSQWHPVPIPREPPPGTIVAWYGPIEEIPEGWVLCDGTNGTPNLVGRFLRGSASPGGTGGGGHTHTLTSGDSHTHSVADASHRHYPEYGRGTMTQCTTNAYYTDTHTHGHYSSTSTSHDHGGLASANPLPPYQEVAFIMRLGW